MVSFLIFFTPKKPRSDHQPGLDLQPGLSGNHGTHIRFSASSLVKTSYIFIKQKLPPFGGGYNSHPLETLVFQIPAEKAFGGGFWGPITSSQGVWKPREKDLRPSGSLSQGLNRTNHRNHLTSRLHSRLTNVAPSSNQTLDRKHRKSSESLAIMAGGFVSIDEDRNLQACSSYTISPKRVPYSTLEWLVHANLDAF